MTIHCRILLLFVAGLTNAIAAPAEADPSAFRCEFVAESAGFPDGTATGTFACEGVVRDTGTCVVQYSVDADGAVQAAKTLTGQHGTIVMQLRGTFLPIGPLHAVVPNGVWTVTGGTGAYATLRGRGRFRTRVEFDNQTFQSGHLAARYLGAARID